MNPGDEVMINDGYHKGSIVKLVNFVDRLGLWEVDFGDDIKLTGYQERYLTPVIKKRRRWFYGWKS